MFSKITLLILFNRKQFRFFFERLDQSQSQRILCVKCKYNFRTCTTLRLDLQVSRRIFNWNMPLWSIQSMCMDNYVYMSRVELHESTALWPNTFCRFASNAENIGRKWFPWFQIMHIFILLKVISSTFIINRFEWNEKVTWFEWQINKIKIVFLFWKKTHWCLWLLHENNGIFFIRISVHAMRWLELVRTMLTLNNWTSIMVMLTLNNKKTRHLLTFFIIDLVKWVKIDSFATRSACLHQFFVSSLFYIRINDAPRVFEIEWWSNWWIQLGK